MPLSIERVATPTDDARALVDELEAELSGPFPAEQRHGLSVAQVFRPNVRFFIARLDGVAVGCGGIAIDAEGEAGSAEVKRMYVRPPWRGRAVGRAILARLEDEARARGVGRLVLETGDVLHPAIRLYEAAGFVRCAAFGAYADMPARSIERSVFLEKRL